MPGGLLPRLFTITCLSPGRLSVFCGTLYYTETVYPAVSWHHALWSPDFPPALSHAGGNMTCCNKLYLLFFVILVIIIDVIIRQVVVIFIFVILVIIL